LADSKIETDTEYYYINQQPPSTCKNVR